MIVKIGCCRQDAHGLCDRTRHLTSAHSCSTICDCTAAIKAYLIYIAGEACRIVEVIWGVHHRHEGSSRDELMCDWSDVSPARSTRIIITVITKSLSSS